MRAPPAALALAAVPLVAVLAGCFAPASLAACGDVVLFLGEKDGAPALLDTAPAPGAVRLGDFEEAFLTDAARPFLSDPVSPGLRITGDVSLELWIRSGGAPAPLAVGDERDDGYHLFNQFGSDRTLAPAYAVEFDDALTQPGHVGHYLETLPMAPGGFHVEEDFRIRVLLTSLVASGGSGRGHEVLVGGDTPSAVSFHSTCVPRRTYTLVAQATDAVELPGHQGLLTGAIPPTEGINMHTAWFDLHTNTTRLTIELRQGPDANPVKDDMDLVIVSANGTAVYSAGSPHADETAVLWEDNLRAFMPPGRYGARVHSYSGVAYQGSVTIIQEA